MGRRVDDLTEWADADDWPDAETWREVLREEYVDADDEAFDDALEAVLDGMSAAEAFSFKKALRQLGTGAGAVATTALPVGAGALGTLIGGPAGTAIGSRLGTLAAGALARPGAPVPVPTPAAAGGSAAAAQGLVLTQQPDVLKALLALSMGQHGARQVGGVPVASVMNLLSSVFGQAAADADEIAYLDGDDAEEADPDVGSGRSLYTALMDAENEELGS